MNSFKKIKRMLIAVLAVLAFAAGLASAAVPATRTITAGTGSGTAGQTAEVLIPITIDYPDGVGVGGIAFTIVYDPVALTFLGLAQATPGQTINDGSAYQTQSGQYANPYTFTPPAPQTTLFFQYNDVKDAGNQQPLGQILVAAASAEPLTGTTLFKARFQINTAAVGGLTYPIRLFRSIIKNTAAGYSATGDFLPILVGTGDKVGGMYTSVTFPVIPASLVAGGITVNATSYGIGGKVTYGSGTGALGAGCTVILKKDTATGYVFNDQTLVGTNGFYSFSGKYPGNYKITVQSLDPNYDNYESSVIPLTNVSITNANAVLPAKPQPVRFNGEVTSGIIPGLLAEVKNAVGTIMGVYGVGTDGKWTSALLPPGAYSWSLVYGNLRSGPYTLSTSNPNTAIFNTNQLGTISGTITGIPPSGSAAVTATSATGKLQKTVPVTSDGAYPTISNLVPASDYIVSVVATGLPVTYYAGKTDISQATKVNVTAGNATENINFTFVQPTGHITGWIKNSGVGVTGIIVYGFEVNTFALVQATTVAGGGYDLGVKPGTYEVFVIKPNGKIFYFYDTTGNGIPTERESSAVLRTVVGFTDTVANTNIDIAECDKTLTGKVTYRSATGDPVANVLIAAFTATNRALGLTGQDGRYSVGGLCDGSAYTVEMKPLTGNYPVQSATVTIVGSNTAKNFIINTGAVLSGTVQEEVTSNPVNGAMIFLKDKETGALVGGRVYFSASGAYSIRDVASGSYTLEVTHPDYRSYTVDFLIGSEDMTQNVVLGKGAYFKGTITDPVNNLAGATVIVTRAGTTPVYTVTNSEGFYSVYGLDAGQSYIVIAQKPGYERQAQSGKIPTTTPGTTVNFSLTLPTVFYTVSGAVTTNVPAPVIGASVLVSSQLKNFFASATTAADGTYSIPGLVNATDYRIVVIPGGNLPTQSRDFVVSGVNVTQDFTIALGESIGGTVSGPASGSLVYVFLYKGTEYVGFVDTTDGSFSFKGLTPGSDYKVLVVASGYVSQWLNDIPSGTTNVSITLVTP